jgi:tripartite-type tricarboxylate transporter receptor subunit TctC
MKILVLFLCLLTGVCHAEKSAIYVSNPPGGISDLLARFIAKNRRDTMVVNIPGALTQQAPKQAFQTHQPLIVETSTLIIDPIIYGRDRTYDIITNFKEIILLGTAPNVLLVPDNNPAIGIQSFRRWAEESNVDLTYATSGSMTHIAALELLERLGLSGRRIPYRGGINATQAVMRNEVVFHVGNLVGAKPALATKKVRGIMLPKETFKTRGYYGIAFPPGMAPETIAAWRQVISDLFSNKETRSEIEQFGFEVDLVQGIALEPWIRKETTYYEEIIKRYRVSE